VPPSIGDNPNQHVASMQPCLHRRKGGDTRPLLAQSLDDGALTPARSASYVAPAVSGSRDGLISCYLRSVSLRRGQARELEAEALDTLPRLRVIGLRVRSRLLLSVEIKSAPPLDLG
jgi:hypothetical protein